MERITRFRASILLLVFFLIVSFFAFRLYDLQIIETGGVIDNTTTFTTRTRVKASRGDLLDRNGNALVSNRASYDLVFNYYLITNAENTNDLLLQLVKLSRELGIEYIDNFPITKERPFEYTLQDFSPTYQSYFQAYLANRGNLDSDITAHLLIQKLRDVYKIPETWTDEEARWVLGLRYELALRGGITNLPNYIFVEDISDTHLSAIRELNIPGLNVEPSTVREYNTDYAAHIIGYVGAMSPEQWEYYKNIDGYEMDSQVGQDGLEEAFEAELHGVDGIREDVYAADGTLVSSRYIKEPIAGNNVEVSIDLELQRIAEEALADAIEELRAQEPDEDGADAQGGAVVAMEVKTGEVLVCGSYPTYSLINFFEDYNEILKQDYDPLFNRALQGLYPPGSTYKMSMVAAAINNGLINSETIITDKGIFEKYDDFQPTCLAYSKNHQTHGDINAMQALEESCNYFFYELAEILSLSQIDAMAKGLGLGESTGVELYEYVGHRANEETKKANYTGSDALWYPADELMAAIGQSENRFTPMQLCVYASTLANQGRRYRATFLNRVVSADYHSLVTENNPELLDTTEINDEAYRTYVEGMKLVATSGTASGTFQYYPIAVAAKTGTAQTDKTTYSDHAAFVAFAPADDPKIAVAVYGEHAGHGSGLAKIAKAIFDVYFDVDFEGDVILDENKIS